jgi:hypothetical protein
LKGREWSAWHEDLDAIEKEFEEEKSMLGAARPTERVRTGPSLAESQAGRTTPTQKQQQAHMVAAESGE